MVVALATAAPASAGYEPGGQLPGACASALFQDVVATLGGDIVAGNRKAERIYGMTGNDWLIGSPNRASCLFGGRGDDFLQMGAGGGVALGERGNDLLVGSARTDALSGGDHDDTLIGGESADILRADKGTDVLDGGPGDDVLDARDGRAELVTCGAGTDTAVADGLDVLLGCERTQIKGPRLRFKEVTRKADAARLRWTVPETAGAGEWRVLVLNCDGTLGEVARMPAVKKGRRTTIGIPAPAGGWCEGAQTGAIVRARPCPPERTCAAPPPPVPLAYLRF